MITGESIPVEKTVGDEAIGATMNTTGAFRLRATKVGKDTALAQIVRLVQDAQASKVPIQRIVDVVSGYFTPAVLIMAIGGFVLWYDFGPAPAITYAVIVAVTTLIIACPCALGMATPMSLTTGVGKGAENGILIRSGDALQVTSKLDSVILDKTGTITCSTARYARRRRLDRRRRVVLLAEEGGGSARRAHVRRSGEPATD